MPYRKTVIRMTDLRQTEKAHITRPTRTCAQLTYGATRYSTLRCLKIRRTILQISHCKTFARPSNNLVAASSCPCSYFPHAACLSRMASACSCCNCGLIFLFGVRPGKTKTGLMRNFSRTRKSDSMRVTSARGGPPVAASSGSLDGGKSRRR